LVFGVFTSLIDIGYKIDTQNMVNIMIDYKPSIRNITIKIKVKEF